MVLCVAAVSISICLPMMHTTRHEHYSSQVTVCLIKLAWYLCFETNMRPSMLCYKHETVAVDEAVEIYLFAIHHGSELVVVYWLEGTFVCE